MEEILELQGNIKTKTPNKTKEESDGSEPLALLNVRCPNGNNKTKDPGDRRTETDTTSKMEMGTTHQASNQLEGSWRSWSKKEKGRPTTHWIDDIPEVAGRDWIKTAPERNKYRQQEKACTRKAP